MLVIAAVACERPGGAESPGPGATTPKIFAVIAPSGLNLRARPTVDSPVLGLLPFKHVGVIEEYTEVQGVFEDRAGVWLRTKFGTKAGYIFSGFVVLGDDRAKVLSRVDEQARTIERNKPATWDHEQPAPHYLAFQPDGIAVRDRPNTAGSVLGFMGLGTTGRAFAVSKDGRWVRIHETKERWVPGEALLPLQQPWVESYEIRERTEELLLTSFREPSEPLRPVLQSVRSGKLRFDLTEAAPPLCGGKGSLFATDLKNQQRALIATEAVNVRIAPPGAPYRLVVDHISEPCSCGQWHSQLILLETGNGLVLWEAGTLGDFPGYCGPTASQFGKTTIYDSATRTFIQRVRHPLCLCSEGDPECVEEFGFTQLAGYTREHFIIVDVDAGTATTVLKLNENHRDIWDRGEPGANFLPPVDTAL